MTIMLLILSIALTPVLCFAASLVGGVIGFVTTIVFLATKSVAIACFRRVVQPSRSPKST